jgi:hypothetical protein
MQKEVRILVHLCSKVTPEMLEYRPTPKQRSTMELLRYLTGMGPILVSSIKKGEFLVDAWNAAQSGAETLDFDAVVERLQALSPLAMPKRLMAFQTKSCKAPSNCSDILRIGALCWWTLWFAAMLPTVRSCSAT